MPRFDDTAPNPRPPARATPYRELSREDRIAAVAHLMQREPGFRAATIRRFVLRAGGFRPETLRTWSHARLATEVVRRHLENRDDEASLVAVHYVDLHPEIQIAFLDAHGVPHDSGRISDEAPEVLGTTESVIPAALALYQEFGATAHHYLRCLQEYYPERWEGLDEALSAVDEAIAGTTAEASIGQVPAEDAAPVPTLVAEAPAELYPSRLTVPGKGELHVLDDVVTLAVINAAKGVDGAPTIEEARRLVAEFVRVNGQRHQSWYAAGLYRALLGEDGDAPGPAEAPGARRWFLAGRVAGLWRQGDLDGIARLYDDEADCQRLGDDGEGPSHHAAPLVFAALWGVERFEDAVAFVHPRAAARSRPLFESIYMRASDLLALRDWAHARSAFDLLRDAVAILESEGNTSLREERPVIERRQAHCRRLAGELQAAQAILEPMLEDETIPPEARGMMQVDMALMSLHYRELAELVLPDEQGEAMRIAAALEGVRDRLEKAIALDPDGAAHAHYVLGFQALLHENGTAATTHLERALSAFRARPEVYTRQGVLERAGLFDAVAICLDHNQPPARVRDAAERIIDSTAEELKIPGWLLESVLTGIAMADRDRATKLATRLLELRPGDVVEQFMSFASELAPVAVSLAALARDPDRPMDRRLAAARRAIPALVGHGDLDAADDLLLMLFEQAMKGVGRREVLDGLSRPESLLQLRDADDLMVLEARLLLAEGHVETAIARLHQLALQHLAAETPWQRAEAAAVIELLEEIPAADEIAATLRARLDRAHEKLEPPTPPTALTSVRILVVGGNEAQARYEESIRAALNAQAPYIIPTFITTGWSANWGDTARDVIRRLEAHDGLVLHYFIRTMFGRKVRKAVGHKPWRAVGGHGRDGILRGIYACAEAVLQQNVASGPGS